MFSNARVWVLAILLALVALPLAACGEESANSGNNGGGSEPNKAEAPAEKDVALGDMKVGDKARFGDEAIAIGSNGHGWLNPDSSSITDKEYEDDYVGPGVYAEPAIFNVERRDDGYHVTSFDRYSVSSDQFCLGKLDTGKFVPVVSFETDDENVAVKKFEVLPEDLRTRTIADIPVGESAYADYSNLWKDANGNYRLVSTGAATHYEQPNQYEYQLLIEHYNNGYHVTVPQEEGLPSLGEPDLDDEQPLGNACQQAEPEHLMVKEVKVQQKHDNDW